MRTKLYFLAASLVLSLGCLAQGLELRGEVKDENGNGVPYAYVLLKTKETDDIVQVAYANERGEFAFKAILPGIYTATAMAMGFEGQPIELMLSEDKQFFDIRVKAVPMFIEEVMVYAQAPVIAKKDTLVFNAKFYQTGKETAVEDIIRNIPGMSVDKFGKIRYGDQEVGIVMVEGDDMFGKGYVLLTKNLPVHPIESIELISNRPKEQVLKGIKAEKELALNIKLKKDFKALWFGNASLQYGLGIKHPNRIQANLMNFRGEHKFHFTYGQNNIGEDLFNGSILGEQDYSFNSSAFLGDDQTFAPRVSLSPDSRFEAARQRTHFNNEKMVSGNSILKMGKMGKLRINGVLSLNNGMFFSQSAERYKSIQPSIVNIQSGSFNADEHTSIGGAEWETNLSDRSTLKMVFQLSGGASDKKNSLLFNGDNRFEQLNTTHKATDTKVTFSYRLSNTQALITSARFISKALSNQFTINDSLFRPVFGLPYVSMDQLSKDDYRYLGAQVKYYKRWQGRNLLEMFVGGDARYSGNSSLQRLYFEPGTNDPYELPGNIDTEISKFFLGADNQITLGKLKFTSSLKANVFKLRHSYSGIHKTFEPSLTVSTELLWRINGSNSLEASHSYYKRPIASESVLPYPLISGSRVIRMGRNSFDLVSANVFGFRYQLGGWGMRYLTSLSGILVINGRSESTNTDIFPSFTRLSSFISRGGHLLSLNFSSDYLFYSPRVNVKAKGGYTQRRNFNGLNNSIFQWITFASSSFGFEIKTIFKTYPNLHLGNLWTGTKVQTNSLPIKYSGRTSFVDASYSLNNKIDIHLKTEQVMVGQTTQDRTVHNFFDIICTYKFGPKTDFKLSILNVLNHKYIHEYAANEVFEAHTQFRMIPRLLLLKLDYKF